MVEKLSGGVVERLSEEKRMRGEGRVGGEKERSREV